MQFIGHLGRLLLLPATFNDSFKYYQDLFWGKQQYPYFIGLN